MRITFSLTAEVIECSLREAVLQISKLFLSEYLIENYILVVGMQLRDITFLLFISF